MWVYVEDVDEDIGRLLLQDWVVCLKESNRRDRLDFVLVST